MFSPDGSNCKQHVPEGVKGIIFKGPTDTYITCIQGSYRHTCLQVMLRILFLSVNFKLQPKQKKENSMLEAAYVLPRLDAIF